jgi:hypothetical protein
LSIITYVHQLKDYFENNPPVLVKSLSPKEKEKRITKIFHHKKKEKTTRNNIKSPNEKDDHLVKTSTPIQQPQNNNNKKKSAPPPPPQLYESHKQYMNPFDSSEDENDGVKNPFSTIKNDNTPIIEIKQNGEIIDALISDNKEYDEVFD